MRHILVPLSLSLAACAGPGSSIAPRPQPPAAVHETSTSIEVRLSRDERAVGDVVALERDAAWDAVLTTYGDLGVPIEAQNRVDGVVTSSLFRMPRRLLDRRLSSYLDCGYSIAGARVDLWAVSARLVTALESSDKGLLVNSRLSTSARPRDGTSTPPVPCSSNGLLEREIVRLVREHGGGS